jgi:excisionase family DNA binding protein
MTTEPELISLDEAAKRLGFTKLYVRTLVRRGKLKTKKVPLGPASQVWKHMIVASDVANFGKRRGKSSRPDGRFKWILYASKEELDTVKELFRANELGELADLIGRQAQTSAYKRRKAKQVAKILEGKNASN